MGSCSDTIVKTYDYYGFPVVDGEKLLGFITRDKLRLALGTYGMCLLEYAFKFCHRPVNGRT
jgi:CBS domain-containing protein